MKKFAKMSLVAAVAVAGLSSTVSAKDLSEAIQGVDVSGTAVLRYNDYTAKSETNKSGVDGVNNYTKLVVNVKAPINDTLTFNTSVSSNNDFDADAATTNTGAEDEGVEVSKINFTSTGIKNTAVTVGKMGVPTVFTVASDSDGKEQIGTGALGTVKAGPVTITAAYFNQTNFTSKAGGDLAVISAKTNIAGVSIDASYADERNTLDVYSFGADYTTDIDGVKISLGARHTASDDDNSTTEGELTQGYIKASMGMFAGFAKYGENGNKGGAVGYDASAKTQMEGWNTNLLSTDAEAEYLMLGVSAQVLPTFNVAINHFEKDISSGNTGDEKELYTQLTWTPSKNFYTYVRLGLYEEDDAEKSKAGRLQIEYKF